MKCIANQFFISPNWQPYLWFHFLVILPHYYQHFLQQGTISCNNTLFGTWKNDCFLLKRRHNPFTIITQWSNFVAHEMTKSFPSEQWYVFLRNLNQIAGDKIVNGLCFVCYDHQYSPDWDVVLQSWPGNGNHTFESWTSGNNGKVRYKSTISLKSHS